MSGLHLHDPLWLAALAPVLLVFLWSERRRRRTAILFSSLADLSGRPATWAARVRPLLDLARLAALGLIVVALARPQQGLEQFRVRAEGIAIALVLDRSGSMDALDFYEEDGRRMNRLSAVKQVVRRFVEGEEASELAGRVDDQVGLVVFGGYPEARCPLTLDHGVLVRILDGVKIPGEGLSPAERRQRERFLEGEGATAIGDALARGVLLVKDAPAESRVLILLSDGENNAGVLSPLTAAELAAEEGVKVYTIGIGSTGLAPFRMVDQFGRTFLQQQQVVLDEKTLTAIAEETGGRYFNARSTEALHRVYDEIDALEKTEVESLVYTDYRELFHLALWPGVLLLLLESVLRATRFRSLP